MPKKETDVTRLQVRLTQEQLKKLTELAGADGRSLSSYVRWKLLGEK